MIGKLLEFLKNLVLLAVFGGIVWYGFSMWKDPSPPVNDAVPGGSFNSRVALADLAKGYACRESASCEMTEYELSRLEWLEIDISIYCN